MLKSFLKIAFRYLWRKKTYSILNFVCLTFGLICAVITVLYIRNVFSYDKFHKNYNRLYAVDAWVTFFNGDRFPKEYLSASLTDVLKEQAPEIEEIIRIAEKNYSFINGNKTFTERGIYADNNFFNVFTFPMVKSGSLNVLTDPNSIVISERMALKGKILTSHSYSFFRQSLIVFQFVIPIVLIICMMIIKTQDSYMRNFDVGVDQDKKGL